MYAIRSYYEINSDGSYIYTLTKPYDTSPDANNGANTEENKDSFTSYNFV